MIKILRRPSGALALSAAAVLALAACASTTDSATTTETGSENTVDTAVDTTTAVESGLWGDNVTVTIGDDGTWNFVSDGIPNHELADQYLVPGGDFTPPVDETEVSIYDAADVITETPLDVDITLNPVYSDTVTETSLGIIGVAISGAQIFNDYEDQDRSFVAVDDNFTVDGVTFVDTCNGHPLALNAGGGNYHYHGVPYCITDAIDVEGEHSTMLGVLADGFPIYGPTDEDGVAVDRADLDECNGEFGPTPEFPDGIYHYHIMEDMSPYMPDCYHGEVTVTANDQGAGPGGAGPGGAAPDFTEAAATLGVTADELTAALGEPPFDLDAAAEILGVTPEELEAALPAAP